MNWGIVTKTRELIDCGYYDDPEVLDTLLDCCIDAILRDVNRSGAKKARGRHRLRVSGGAWRRRRVPADEPREVRSQRRLTALWPILRTPRCKRS